MIERRYRRTIGTSWADQKANVKLPLRPDKLVLDPGKSILGEIHQ